MQALLNRLGGIKGIGGERLAPMPEADIVAFETELGIRLPEEYRRFLATYGASAFNGASPDNPYILFRPLTPLPARFKSGKGSLDALYGGQKDEHDPYSVRVRAHFFSGRMPKNIIPIGDDGIAGQICLGIRGPETGKVYYWDQQDEPPDEQDYLVDHARTRPPGMIYQNVFLIAESFGDFLQRLEVSAD
jgi:hypothetical protein